MSITTLKRKTDGSYHVSGANNGKFGGGGGGKGYINRISSGRPAFTLNDPRRVSAQSGKESIQTRMRGIGYRGHGGNYGSFIINPLRSNYQNDYDPFKQARRGKPVIVPACPVVQQTKPASYATQYQEKDAVEIKKDLCDPTSKNSGHCGKSTNFPNHLGRKSGTVCYQESTFVKRKQMDYSQYIQKKKAPLTGDKSHYPPMVSRNSTFVSVPNFSYSDFIKRLQCK
jgi:hypothetical protein